MSNRRKGKIASLTFELRTKVNTMLRDGVKYSAVIKFLEKNDVFGLNEQNITNWHQGGYQEWLKEQERLADMQAKREFAFEIVRSNEGSKLHEANLHLAASQLYEVLTDFDLQDLKDLLKDEPENYAAIINSLAKLSKGHLDLRKYQDAVAKAQVELQKLRDPKQKLSDTDRLAIVEKVDEILGIK